MASMQNRVDALRVHYDGSVTLLPVEWSDSDELVCESPQGNVVVPPHDVDEDQFQELIDSLQKQGHDPHGCFDCRYFTRSGMCEGTVGYCIHGRLGVHVKPPQDLTTMERGCDAHVFASDSDREEARSQWSSSLPRGRPTI